MENKRRVAVFDIDGTVFRSSLLAELVNKLVERGIFPKEIHSVYEKERVDWLERRGDYSDYISTVVSAFKEQIKGVPYADAADIAGEVIEGMKGRVYKYTRDLIKDLKGKGYFVLAVSHSPKFIVDGFGYELGFDKTYGTFYETGASGRFTGEVADMELIMNKGLVLQRVVNSENLTLDGSFAVGDTESDISMFELVETPIVFNPNHELYRHAKRNKWNIVVERKDVIYKF